MTVFVIMYILMILCWIFSSYMPIQKRTLVVCIASFFILWFIQTFRAYYIGVDLPGRGGYIDFFENSDHITKAKMEVGYFYFNKCIRIYTANPTVFLAAVSAAFLLPISFIIRKFSNIPILSFIIIASFVLYIFSFSALRQTIAIGITTLSYYYIYKRQIIPHYLLVALAYLFHSSAIIFIIAYPLCNFAKISKSLYFYIFICFIISLFSLKSIVNWLLPLVFSEDRYLSYIESDAGMAYNLALLIFLFFLFTFLNKKPSQNDLNFQKLVFCALVCQSLGLISPVAPRVGFYFFVYISLALPNTIKNLMNYQARTLASVAIAVFMIYFFFSKYTNGYLNVMPYSFVWE